MNRHLFKSASLSVILLLGTAGFVAQAVEVNVGGTSVNTGSTGTDAVSGTATVGGGDNIASAHFDANGNLIDVNIGRGSGPLATANQGGNPANNTSTTAASVNLGSLLSGLDVGGGLPGTPGASGTPGAGGMPGGGGAGGPQNVFAGMSAADRGVVKLRCATVMKSPNEFKADVVQFCQIIAKM
jgi:hypothetical protein